MEEQTKLLMRDFMATLKEKRQKDEEKRQTHKKGFTNLLKKGRLGNNLKQKILEDQEFIKLSIE